MSDFVPGLITRSEQVDAALKRAFDATEAFVARSVVPQVRETGPRHFSPVSPGHRATEGWDIFDPNSAPTDGMIADELDAGAPEFEAADPAPVQSESLIATIASAREDGYAEGFAAGLAQAKAEAEAAAAAQADLLRQLGEEMGKAGQIDRVRLAEDLRHTVFTLVSKMIGETAVPADILTARVKAAADQLTDGGEQAILRLNPEDLLIVQSHLPAQFTAVGDPARPQGSFMLESASTLIEDGPDQWLDQLAQNIDHVPLPVDQ